MHTNSTFSIVFFTKESRTSPSKLLIYARITVNGKRTEISMKRFLNVQESNSRIGEEYALQKFKF